MNSFNFKRRNLASGPHLLGVLLISVDKALVVGIRAIILGLVIVSAYSGTLIDFTEKRKTTLMIKGQRKNN